ncbi:cryptochrome/photolyase family protein [Demequina sediminicola]|uniref:cryptochrome/photolyase family protein n=1 Tax=Demequina sediminicola TaxID=1095026 RepID=UPI000781A45F|nr:deoxyribodipyrimidine photo-lyase [Demequina sediminicola]
MDETRPALWWARRDLRISDNPALVEATRRADAGAVFVWTRGIHLWSGRRSGHLARVLWQLRDALGGALAVRRGDAATVVLEAAQEADAAVVWAAREYSPSGITEQESVAAALKADGRALKLIGSPYAVAPGRVTKADGTEYKVFTPFRNAWREHGWRAPAAAADLRQMRSWQRHDADVDLDQMAAHGDSSDPLVTLHEFREDRILEALEDFVASDIDRYSTDRDRPDLDSTSHLSVALAYGQVHPRTVLAETGPLQGDGPRVFESELAWRDFHADVLFHHPQARRDSLTPVLADDDWLTGRESDAVFMVWRDGLTGFPLVDAGMRQLQQTGWMHNRVRMVVASFLVKDLLVPWQRGADYFRRALLDYDHAQNQLNWQWVAGTGRDASPFFRIFNPVTQADKFDPQRRYVQRWVPEVDTPAYPSPIVDHKTARADTLALHQAARSARQGTSN